MTKKKEKRGITNFGFSTILLSFVMICVVTFSALSLVTANSDYKLSKKVADKTILYYEAEEKAYEKLAAIDKLLSDSFFSTTDEYDYFANIENLLGEYGELEPHSNGYYLSFNEQISTNQYLSVKLSIHYPKNDVYSFCDTIEWKSVYQTEVPEDGTLNLIQ